MYQSTHTGAQVDEAVDKALSADAVPTANSTNLVESGGVASAVSAVGDAVSRRNLLDNWYFVGGGSQQGDGQFPINQRGQTAYSGAVYGIDRWKGINWVATANVTVQSGSILLSGTASGSNSCMIRQTIENAAQFAGKEVTVSVLVGAVQTNGRPCVFIGTNANDMYATARLESNGLYSKTAVLPDDITGLFVQIGQHASSAGSGNTSIEIIAVKLELGSTQTLAHQENGVWVLNEIPNFAEELAKCQYYYQRKESPGSGYNVAMAVSASTENTVYSVIPLARAMRYVASPTVNVSGFVAGHSGGAGAVSSPTYTFRLNKSGTELTMNIVSASFATKTTYMLWQNIGGYIEISCDL